MFKVIGTDNMSADLIKVFG